MPEPTNEFITQYTGCQSRLYAFLLALMGDSDQAREVLQETNLVIWKKCDQFEAGTNFMAWALRIARYQAMAYRTKQQRDRLVFSEASMDRIANAFVTYDDQSDTRQRFLRQCLELLAPHALEVVTRRYKLDQKLQAIADETGRTYQAVGQSLRRARLALANCVKQREAQDE